MTENFSLSDIASIVKNQDGFGGNSLIILILFFLFFGMNGANARGVDAGLTQSELQRGFDTTSIQTKLNTLGGGICDSTFAITNAINSNANATNLALTNGFNSIVTGLNNLGFQNQQCCCEIKTALHSEGEATRALIAENEVNRLRTDLQSAQLALSNAGQTQNILNALGTFRPYGTCPCS